MAFPPLPPAPLTLSDDGDCTKPSPNKPLTSTVVNAGGSSFISILII